MARSLATVLPGMRVILMYGLAAVQRELLRVAEINKFQDIFIILRVKTKKREGQKRLLRCFVYGASTTSTMIVLP